jgi:hypothetical protein
MRISHLATAALATSVCIGFHQPSFANQVRFVDLEFGTGPVASSGSRLTVHYVGALSNGKVFDQSTSRGAFSFPLGAGRVIKGWDIGLQGMRAGGIRRLVIPPELAYGSRGVGSVIPPNEELTFYVHLLNIDGVGGGQRATTSSPRQAPRAPRPQLGETLSDTPFYW